MRLNNRLYSCVFVWGALCFLPLYHLFMYLFSSWVKSVGKQRCPWPRVLTHPWFIGVWEGGWPSTTEWTFCLRKSAASGIWFGFLQQQGDSMLRLICLDACFRGKHHDSVLFLVTKGCQSWRWSAEGSRLSLAYVFESVCYNLGFFSCSGVRCLLEAMARIVTLVACLHSPRSEQIWHLMPLRCSTMFTASAGTSPLNQLTYCWSGSGKHWNDLLRQLSVNRYRQCLLKTCRFFLKVGSSLDRKKNKCFIFPPGTFCCNLHNNAAGFSNSLLFFSLKYER